jgi:hypothetical protein
MKKFILSILALTFTSSLFASEAIVSKINSTDKFTYSVIGNNVVYLYKDNEISKYSQVELALQKKGLTETLCKSKDTRNLIDKYGYTLLFIYPGDKSTSIISIDSCN